MSNETNIKNYIEAICFAAADPVSIDDIAEALGLDKGLVFNTVMQLAAEYDERMSGIRLLIVTNTVQMSTREEYAEQIDAVLSPIKRNAVSKSAIEVLSIIAYKQPITRAEINDIRGVRSDYYVSLLLDKGLIEIIGQKDTVGRPNLYGTTNLFLRDFNLSSLEELPGISES